MIDQHYTCHCTSLPFSKSIPTFACSFLLNFKPSVIWWPFFLQKYIQCLITIMLDNVSRLPTIGLQSVWIPTLRPQRPKFCNDLHFPFEISMKKRDYFIRTTSIFLASLDLCEFYQFTMDYQNHPNVSQNLYLNIVCSGYISSYRLIKIIRCDAFQFLTFYLNLQISQLSDPNIWFISWS